MLTISLSFLEFDELGFPTEYQICEPIGWDATNFVQEQESKRWARSVEYGAVEKLDFVDIWGVGVITERAYNVLGDTSNHLDSGLQWLLQGYKKKGFQFKAKFT